MTSPSWTIPLFTRQPTQLIPLPLRALYAELTFWSRKRDGGTKPIVFRYSGANLSTLTLSHAENVQILPLGEGVSLEPVPVTFETAAGKLRTQVIRGRLQGWLSEDCSGEPFGWPMLIRSDESLKTPLLGLTGVIDQLSWTFDGTPSAEYPLGRLCLTDLREASPQEEA